ncbi:hypothetical protein EXIGLDRAFT_729828 [Exidia glandulosa HHB12029]|uniref:Ubiquitin-like domain-containing protein n=1 Tax=Exidia glandulosa HHB12029 TaxID=1314781 RepID=A0A165CFF6_EXIGL|nr:hypothetical protein EXIGLDRAFT_729828 [Exidia glandulosa HHB12029]
MYGSYTQHRPGRSVVLRYHGRRFVFSSLDSLAAATSAARSTFSIPPEDTIIFEIRHSVIKPGSKVGLVELTESSWGLLAHSTRAQVVVEVRTQGPPSPVAPTHTAPPAAPPIPPAPASTSAQPPAAVIPRPLPAPASDERNIYTVLVHNASGTHAVPNFESHRYKVKHAARTRMLYRAVAHAAGVPVEHVRLTFNDSRLVSDESFYESGIRDGAVIEVELSTI